MAALTILLGLVGLAAMGALALLRPHPAYRPKLANLITLEGTLDRTTYAVWGIALFAIKHNLDRAIASTVFHRSWWPWQYLFPGGGARVSSLRGPEASFFAVMLCLALPFIWVGVSLTVRRLRSIGLPPWLAVLFFVPFLNLLFFTVLCVLPAREDEAMTPGAIPPEGLARIIPNDPLGSAAASFVAVVPFGVLLTAFGASLLRDYGWGLFVGIPFAQGLAAALIHGYHRPRSWGSCAAVACASILVTGVLLLFLAVEGVVCLAMAGPFGLGLGLAGGTFGYFLQRGGQTAGHGAAMLVLLAAMPPLMGFERAVRPEPPLRAVRTAIEVDAPPSRVWPRVVAFSEIPPPKERLFRLGIAYPVRAHIEGRGVGALRHCEFSTGEFLEPIEVWDEPRLLRFSVSAQPPTMRETSPYGPLDAPHLRQSFRSTAGQFELTELPGGRTRLEGTTWYQNRLWPAFYWALWSDAIIHRIHLRVLRHIAAQSRA